MYSLKVTIAPAETSASDCDAAAPVATNSAASFFAADTFGSGSSVSLKNILLTIKEMLKLFFKIKV